MTRQRNLHNQRAGWRLICSSISAAVLLLVLHALAPATPAARLGHATALASQSACTEAAATVEELIQVERGAQLAGEGQGLPVEALVAALRTCWQEYAQQMPAAESNCALFKQLAPFVLGWSRQVSLLGLDADFAAEQAQVMPWMVSGLVNCYNEAFDRCVGQNDPAQSVEMLQIERQLNLLGAVDRIDRTKLNRCLRFELFVESVIDRDGLTGVTHTHSLVRTTIPLRLDGAFTISGQAPLDYIEFSMRWPAGDSCTAAVNSFRGSTAVVSSFTYEVVEQADGRQITGLDLVFDPGVTTESVTVQCGRAVNNHTEPYYSGYFGLLHADERTAGGYRIGAWTRGAGPILARKTYSRTITPADSPLPHTEQTTFELRHTPER